MNDYKLLINKGGNVWVAADLMEGDAPAINFGVNDIADISVRNNDYTQRLSLPITHTNADIFGYTNSPFVRSAAPYSRFECRLLRRGVEIFGKGAYLTMLSIKENKYEVCIASGIKAFFDALEAIDFTLAEYEDFLGSFTRPINGTIDRMLDTDNTNVWSTDAHGICVPIMQTDINGELYENIMKEDVYWYCYPAIMLGNPNGNTGERNGILTTILDYLGYTLDCNATEYFNRYLFGVPDRKAAAQTVPDVHNFTIFDVYDWTTVFTGLQTEGELKTDDDISSWKYGHLELSKIVCTIDREADSNGFFWRKITVTSPDGTNVKTKTLMNDGTSSFVLYSNGTHTVTGSPTPIGQWDGESSPVDCDLTPDATIKVEIQPIRRDPLQPCTLVANHIQVTAYYDVVSDGETACPGTDMKIAPNMGWKTAKDFFKTFVQMFGLIVSVDETNKVVHAHTFKEVYDNKVNAIDWTNKLDEGESPEINYTIGKYAKKNNIKLKANSKDGYISQSSFYINNDALEVEADLIELNLESTDFIYGFTWHNEFDSEAGLYPYEKLDAPQVAFINKNFTLEWVNAATFLLNYYANLKDNMLQNAFILKAKFYLQDRDVTNRDVYVPIYLKQYGAYFYVNKIKNYVSGKTTEVELIRL